MIISRRGIVDYGKIRKLTEEIISEYDVATPSPDTKAKNLSGGNLQKLILARVLSRKPRLVIANLPTQGLDVGATEFVRNKLMEAKKEKAGILLISEDLDEVLSLSDWVAPIYEGKFMDIIPGEEAERESVGAMMAGSRLEGSGDMRIGSYELKLEKRVTLTGWQAARHLDPRHSLRPRAFQPHLHPGRDQPAARLPGDLFLRFRQPFWPAADDQPVHIPVAVYLRIHHPFQSRALEHRDDGAALRRGVGRFCRPVCLWRKGV